MIRIGLTSCKKQPNKQPISLLGKTACQQVLKKIQHYKTEPDKTIVFFAASES